MQEYKRPGAGICILMAISTATGLQRLSSIVLEGKIGAPDLSSFMWQPRKCCLRFAEPALPVRALRCAVAGLEVSTLQALLSALQEFVLRRACLLLFLQLTFPKW